MRARPRPARPPRGGRPAHLATRPGTLVPVAGPAPRACSGRDRRADAAFPRRADQPQPAPRWSGRAGDVERCRERGAEAAILVANCPVCHQTIEPGGAHVGSRGHRHGGDGGAKDIVEHCGVPRFLFSDFPLGNAGGPPYDVVSQDATLALALDLVEAATGPARRSVEPAQVAGSARLAEGLHEPRRPLPAGHRPAPRRERTRPRGCAACARCHVLGIRPRSSGR